MKLVTGALVALAMAAPGVAAAGPIANGQGWTGFYVGGHVGAGFPEISGEFDSGGVPVDLSDLEEWAFAAGGQIGYDYQAPGMGGIVLGVVVDASYVDYEGDATDTPFIDNDMSASVDWLASVRIRAGYPVADIMPYATVGAAYTEVELSHMDSVGGNAWSAEEDDWGYVAGFGIDWAVMPSVTVGAEALFYQFDIEADLSGLPDGDAGDSVEFGRLMTFRVTANYRF